MNNDLLSVHFAIPGNIRWNCPILYRNPRLARKVESILQEHIGVTGVTANPLTGRVQVLFLPESPITAIVRACGTAIRAALDSEPITVMPVPMPYRRSSRQARMNSLAVKDRGSSKPPLGVVAVGAATIAIWLVVQAALKVFSRSSVIAGLTVFAGSTASLVYVLNEEPSDDHSKLDRDYTLRELRRIARPYRRDLVLGMVMVIMGRVCQVATIAVAGVLIDSMLASAGVSILGKAVLAPGNVLALGTIAAALTLGCSLFDYLSKLIWMRAAHQIAHDLRLTLYEHIQSIEMAQITDANRSTYLALLNDDINRIELLFESTWASLREIGFAACSVVCFFIIAPAFAALLSVPLPGLLLLAYWLEKTIRPRYVTLRNEAGKLQGMLASTLDGVETTRAFNMESKVADWVSGASRGYRDEQGAALKIVATYDPAMWAAANTIRLVTCIAAGVYLAAGMMSVGSYLTLVNLAFSLALPLRGIARDFPHILSTLASLSRVFEAFHLPVENRNDGLLIDSREFQGAIRFEKIIFMYPAGHPVFRDFSVDIPTGQVTGFVGATGSGKSTLAKLLLRFYDPEMGHIFLDQWDLKTLRRTEVREKIAYVGQEVFLFNASIRDNIAFGLPDVLKDDIIEAARIAGAHDFIFNLPAGYDTITGERGQKLSGGEKQRLGIARAIMLKRPVVILDEATSSLDAVTEADLIKQLKESLAGRTVIVIAHRLSAVRHADCIHVIADGSIQEAGSHEELLKQGGLYATYWEIQTREETQIRDI
ncbi:MAG TPA: ABC transporter ATP-binding protein [Candidatus Angelobacter sp.]|nr:ABC transporter ATP-binding protein [Candidatus Angelobacter sp.]